jgi:hypothetical protein
LTLVKASSRRGDIETNGTRLVADESRREELKAGRRGAVLKVNSSKTAKNLAILNANG